ncbi:MAG TPA: TetR/AcrR family transcriptional regulator C-terminal ligand-binding domain-containing protein [Mycobacterium sp.]|nr:TetR/AcrR family transcriptional regulator C-terminal ligand-binding domain-containing protein [Mycobacterium sp.]
MTKPDDADAEAIRGVVLKAAFDELVDRGIDRFTVDRVAKRAGVEPDVIIAIWGDRRILLMDAVLSSSESVIPIPDTGTLRGDLSLAFEAAVTIASTREGRRQLYSMLPRGRDFDPTEVQRDFWDNRLIAWAVTFRRAQQRGELREGVDPMAATRMLAAAVNFDVLFADNPISAEYVDQVLDMFLHGVVR